MKDEKETSTKVSFCEEGRHEYTPRLSKMTQDTNANVQFQECLSVFCLRCSDVIDFK